MKVTVKLGAPLSQVVGESKVILTVPEATTAAGVLDALRARYPDFEEGLKGKGLRYPVNEVLYSLFVNSRPVPLERADALALCDGDRLFLFLPVAGG
jgi:molybdopterin converting factor small subunit